MDWIAIPIVILILGLLTIIVCSFHFSHKRKIRVQITGLAKCAVEMTPEEFIEMRKTSFGGKGNPYYSLKSNFAGVYILYNKTKGKYYVGQGKYILNRINSHFTGKGNGDVYADYKYGDEFTIKAIALKKSGYKNLNDLERDTIATFDAFAKGYNKTRGNS